MLRAAARSLAFRSGAMHLLHRMHNRECLTVVMFHRVLPSEEQSHVGADPGYTVTPQLLAECVEFLTKHYTIVSLKDVLASHRRTRPLPPYPAMITFDDGWYDNFEWARPLLEGIPWTLFVATHAASEPNGWWQETLLQMVRSCRADFIQLVQAAETQGARFPGVDETNSDELRLILGYGTLPAQSRRQVLAALERPGHECPHMMTAEQLVNLARSGVAIGGHGSAHLPLTLLPNAQDDLRCSRDWLSGELGADAALAMSFPHGRWNSEVAQMARSEGFELLFTSDAVLNACGGGWLDSDLIGRIPLATHDIADLSGHLAESRLAAWLSRRKRQTIHG